MDQKESSLGIELFSLVTSFGPVPSNSAPTTTTFNGSQAKIQLANGAYGTDDQSKDMRETYSVFLHMI